MNVILRTKDRILLSISTEEWDAIEKALGEAVSAAPARQCLARLGAQLEARPVSEELDLLSAWTDGASVQVRAITAHADPVDLGADEAREFATRILKCAAEAE